MAERVIIAVGLDLHPDVFRVAQSTENDSLLDADIIVIAPSFFSGFHAFDTRQTYQGKPSFPEDTSFRLKECFAHWRSELSIAVDSGKTVFVFLKEPLSAFVDTGERQYSGTGRNRITTHVVTPISSYDCLPWKLGSIVPRTGEGISFDDKSGLMQDYWTQFGPSSYYGAYLKEPLGAVFATTKTGGLTVGTVCKTKTSNGHLVLLPLINVEHLEAALPKRAAKGKPAAWNYILRDRLLAIDEALRSKRDPTPPPQWTGDESFLLPTETELRASIRASDEQVESLRQESSELRSQLHELGSLRRLLYEKGPLLEESILEALGLLGFSASRYKEADSEFDAIFESPEGRALGEAEGRDDRAVNVDKISQLSRNLQEDFGRPEVSEYAKGVLFANGYRLSPPSERLDHFTVKCKATAVRNKIALVQTPDLFRVAQYLKGQSDPDYARLCRLAILSSDGETVVFPSPSE